MIVLVSFGIGAGLVSALLFSAVITGSPVGMVLWYLAPLPILIVALGWNQLSGLLASFVGAAATAVLVRPSAGIAYVLGPALPAWWLAYLALLGRPKAPDGELEWYPLGQLLLWIGLAATCVTIAATVTIGSGTYDGYQTRMAHLIGGLLRYQYGIPATADLPDIAGVPGSEVVNAVVDLVPAGLAAVIALVLTLNLWVAAKAVAISGRLTRPWPLVPTARMPRLALAFFALGIPLALAPSFAGIAGIGAIGGLAMAFALQGLAFLHAVTLGRPGRRILLSLAYFLALFFGQVFLPILALTGLADTASPLRRRLIARHGLSHPPSP